MASMDPHPRGKKRTVDDDEVQLLDDRAEGSAPVASATEVSSHEENGEGRCCSDGSVVDEKSEKDTSPQMVGEESPAPTAEDRPAHLLPIACPSGPDIPLTVPSCSEPEDDEPSVWGPAGFPRNDRPIILPTLTHPLHGDRLENVESSSASSNVTTTEEDSLEEEEEEAEEESETEFMIRFLEL